MRCALLLVSLVSCSLSSRGPQIDIDLDYPRTSLTNNGELPYEPSGAFMVTTTVTITDPDLDVKTMTPMRATVAIVEDLIVPGAITSATVTLAPDLERPGILSSPAALAWPRGGRVHVRVSVAGVTDTIEVPLAAPKPVALAFTAPANGSGAVPGAIVQLTVLATSAGAPARNVPVTFQTSPAVVVIPQSTITDASGVAIASFPMPDLTGGSLVVGALSGSTAAMITLDNTP